VTNSTEPVLDVQGIVKTFRTKRRLRQRPVSIRAVDGVSFALHPGETVGLVGESGCGKSTLAQVVLGAIPPTSGHVLWKGTDLSAFSRAQLRKYRATVQAVFQDPTSSLNPRMRVSTLIAEPLRIHRRGDRREVGRRVDELLDAVGLDRGVRTSYPHELSGGMRQRVAIARALSLRPDVLVLDEPVSSLDVSVRAQIMNLLKGLQSQFGFSCLLIAHDLASIRYMADRVLVMYLGQIVEAGPAAKVFDNMLHPYTRALVGATLSIDSSRYSARARLSGEIPSPLDPPSGCHLHPRCPVAFGPCAVVVPALRAVESAHEVSCHLHDPTVVGATEQRVEIVTGTD